MAEVKKDLIIIGAGPAGLSAAITAESERLDTLVLDAGERLGGQAGTSSFIENYPGFPHGISGAGLMSKFIDQALRFTTDFVGPTRAEGIERVDDGLEVRTDDGVSYLGETVLIASGVRYRTLRAHNLTAYLGRGATYGSPDLSVSYDDKKVLVIGGANSAGQAAHHLSTFNGCDVKMFVRGDSIEKGMSGYLVDKIYDQPNIDVHTGTSLQCIEGDGRVQKAHYIENGQDMTCDVDEIFVMIGAAPSTLWLPEFAKDERGFIVAGTDHNIESTQEFMERTGGRKPLTHETSMPGVFTAGDIRSGTDKRVALAAGDGAGVVPDIHRYRTYESREE